MYAQISTDMHDFASGGQHGGGHIVKLADFGMAGLIRSDGCLRGRCGTPGYVSEPARIYRLIEVCDFAGIIHVCAYSIATLLRIAQSDHTCLSESPKIMILHVADRVVCRTIVNL